MSAVPASRRDVLRTGVLAAGGLAVAGLVSPLRAAAQASPETEALRDFLAEAIAREQISALAYAEAGQANGLGGGLERTLERLRMQEQAHVNAFTSAIESIGFDAPDAPSDPQDDGVFEDVDGIDSETAQELSTMLARVGEPSDRRGYLDLLIELELGLARFYLDRGPGLDSEDLRTTCAEVAANEAQHLVLLREADGVALAETLSVRVGGSDGSEPEAE